MITLTVGADPRIAAWVAAHLDHFPEIPSAYATIGVLQDGRPIAGVVFHDATKRDMHGTIASIDPKWCSRFTLGAIFRYVFVQCGKRRFTAITSRKNKHARKFLKRLGFHEEGLLREKLEGDVDALVYGMLRRECRWIGEENELRQRLGRPAPAA